MAERTVAGLIANSALFPNLPHPPMGSIKSIRWKVRQYHNRREALIAARSASESATADKDEALENLTEAMKTDLLYAENTVDFDDDKLKLIGWAGRKTKTQLAVPGQTRLLETPKQGAGWLLLDWKAPADGSAPNAYKVQRRSDGSWRDIATAILTEAILVDQPEKSSSNTASSLSTSPVPERPVTR